MTFTSLEFAALFVVVILGRLTLGRTKQGRPYLWLLVLASLFFYAWHTPWHLSLLLVVAVLNFLAAKQIAAYKTPPPYRALILAVAVTANLSMLAVYKYTNFAIYAINDASSRLALGFQVPYVEILLPIGISFYIFHAISYVLDVYRRKTPAVNGFGSFVLYLAFFPQLVAGPITRAREFLYQIPRRRTPTMVVMTTGAYLMIRGFFMKLVVADNLAAFLDTAWPKASLPDAGSLLALSVVVLFSFQIFADFSGYTDIAQGIAYLLGYRLPLNFNAPYIASSFSEFWRRWHISLSSWLRDYLYVPLGGNRKGRARTYANLLTVMLLGGLWHGAAYTYVTWGAIHGGALAVERALGTNHLRWWWTRLAWAILVQVMVLVAWTFFRSSTVAEANAILANVLGGQPGATGLDAILPRAAYAIPVLLIHARTFLHERGLVPGPSLVERGALAAVMLYLSMTLYGPTSTPFIYFQF